MRPLEQALREEVKMKAMLLRRHARLSAILAFAFLAMLVLQARPAQGQIFVSSYTGSVLASPGGDLGIVGQFNLDGSAINPTRFAAPSATDMMVDGSNLYIANTGAGFAGSIDQYNIVTGQGGQIVGDLFGIESVAVSKNTMFVGYLSYTGRVGKFTTSGEAIDESFISGLQSRVFGIVPSADGTKLYVSEYDQGVVAEYDSATGAVINSSLISGLNLPTGMAIAGSKLFVVNSGNGVIGAYSLDGTPINAALITGLDSQVFSVFHLAEFGGNLYVADSAAGAVSEFDATTGATVNAALITGLHNSSAIAVVPEPAGGTLALVGVIALLGLFCARFRSETVH